ncbi:hypothetical protein QR680_018654 [Steinernema hermaphroditum]|uniref:Uncharacterized protein n=1 Tax=Steinernema hermaphroditum TaxID=289476 RepID=A0AA39HIM6_9BILA|nr:hypothetical protein QR680_018654 [Steinernema hermaphroditum]
MPNLELLFWTVFCTSALFSEAIYPQPATYELTQLQCERRCKSIFSFCRDKGRGYVCEGDDVLLATVIAAAVITGLLIPLFCISMCVCGVFAYVSYTIDDETTDLDDTDEERSSKIVKSSVSSNENCSSDTVRENKSGRREHSISEEADAVPDVV